jgi:hypothetical protein
MHALPRRAEMPLQMPNAAKTFPYFTTVCKVSLRLKVTIERLNRHQNDGAKWQKSISTSNNSYYVNSLRCQSDNTPNSIERCIGAWYSGFTPRVLLLPECSKYFPNRPNIPEKRQLDGMKPHKPDAP